MVRINTLFQYLLCVILSFVYVLYIWFFYLSLEDLKHLITGWWSVSPWFFNHVFFIVFPIFILMLWINRKKIRWIDYSLLYIPPLFWLLFLPLLTLIVLPLSLSSSGSWGNSFIQQPVLIGISLCLYLFRFYFNETKDNRNFKLWKKVGLLWLAIFFVAFCLNVIISYVPSMQFKYK